MSSKKIIRLTERDLTRIIKRILNEDVNVNGVSIGTDAGKIKIGGCKYNISALGFNVGTIEYIKDKGDEYEVKFDGKLKNVDKEIVTSQISKFEGCPAQVDLVYEISFFPDINIKFNKIV